MTLTTRGRRRRLQHRTRNVNHFVTLPHIVEAQILCSVSLAGCACSPFHFSKWTMKTRMIRLTFEFTNLKNEKREVTLHSSCQVYIYICKSDDCRILYVVHPRNKYYEKRYPLVMCQKSFNDYCRFRVKALEPD